MNEWSAPSGAWVGLRPGDTRGRFPWRLWCKAMGWLALIVEDLPTAADGHDYRWLLVVGGAQQCIRCGALCGPVQRSRP